MRAPRIQFVVVQCVEKRLRVLGLLGETELMQGIAPVLKRREQRVPLFPHASLVMHLKIAR